MNNDIRSGAGGYKKCKDCIYWVRGIYTPKACEKFHNPQLVGDYKRVCGDFEGAREESALECSAPDFF